MLVAVVSVCIQTIADDGLGAIARKVEGAKRWNQTLVALESMSKGRVVDGAAVHAWLASWGGSNELPMPKVSG